MQPDLAPALQRLAWLLATSFDDAVRDGPAALALAQRALSSAPEPTAELLDALGAAQAASERFDEAVATLERALELAPVERRAELERRRALYRTGRPHRAEAPR